MSRRVLIPLVVLIVVLLGLLALGLPPSFMGGAPTPVAYEKTLDVQSSK